MIWAMYTEMTPQLKVKPECANAPNGHYCGEEVTVCEDAWDQRIESTIETGANMLVIELAEGPIFQSHPELALKGSKPMTWVNERVRRLKAAGVEVVPLLNFSIDHGNWLGPYSRQIATPTYYRVCRDLLHEAYEVFEKPKYMHFGMDEEDPGNSGVTRQWAGYRYGDLLWHDVDFFAKEVEACGARPWMWSDMRWWWGGDYDRHVSKEILQSNGYYDDMMDYENLVPPQKTQMGAYFGMQKAGFSQVPCVTTWVTSTQEARGVDFNVTNIPATLEWARRTFKGDELAGFLCAPWCGPWKTDAFPRAAKIFRESRDKYFNGK